MSGLGRKFQYDENSYMLAEELEKYALSSVEEDCEYPVEHAPMGFIASGGEFNESINPSHWLDEKHTSFHSPTCSDNIN